MAELFKCILLTNIFCIIDILTIKKRLRQLNG